MELMVIEFTCGNYTKLGMFKVIENRVNGN